MDKITEEKFKITKDSLINFLELLYSMINNLKKQNKDLIKKNNDLKLMVDKYDRFHCSYDW